MNTSIERAATAPYPRATATTTIDAPVVLPATDSRAARLPWASARPTMKSTLGPGITTSTMPGQGEGQQGGGGRHAPHASRGRAAPETDYQP